MVKRIPPTIKYIDDLFYLWGGRATRTKDKDQFVHNQRMRIFALVADSELGITAAKINDGLIRQQSNTKKSTALSIQAVVRHLKDLEERGLVECIDSNARKNKPYVLTKKGVVIKKIVVK